LLIHTSGIRSDHLARQGRLINRYDKEQKIWQLKNILKFKPSYSDGWRVKYSNANYLILGVVIEKLTNTDYETYCNNEVRRILSSYGGWEISPVDYLRFADEYFTNDWITKFPAAHNFHPAMERSRRYGLGVWMRKSYQGTKFWHGGSLRWKSKWQNARFGSYFTVYENGFSVSVNYSKDARDGRRSELADALNLAVANH